MKHSIKTLLMVASLGFVTACNNKDTAHETQGKDTTLTVDSSTSKVPIINIEETITKDQLLMVMEDSAASSEEIGQKLGKIYGAIGACGGKCKMEMSGPPVAWYSGPSAPWKFTAGIPYSTKCEKPDPGISVKEVKGGKAVVAHFFGPYEQTEKAYLALEEWMKENGKQAAGAPYEVYIGDPGVEKDPYKVQTDVVYPIQ